MNSMVIRAAALAVVLGLGWYLGRQQGAAPPGAPVAAPAAAAPMSSGQSPDLAQVAFEERASGRMIRIEGEVIRTLADDHEGSAHQRFIIATDTGTSILISHNIDLAPRLDGIRAGDKVAVYGEYEWNEKGGLMHWTHHDPSGNHPAGYIEWRGRKYQ